MDGSGVLRSLMLVWASVWGGAAPSRAAVAAPRAASNAAVRGQVRLLGTTSPARAAASAVRAGIGRPRVMPLLRPLHRRASAALKVSSAPRVRGHARLQRDVNRPVVSFDGVNAIENSAVSAFDLEPPDEGLGAGNGYVANFVNVTGAIYRTDGRAVTSPFYLNTFFKEPAAANTSDPRVYFDPTSGHWFATLLEYGIAADGTYSESHVDVATSASANPAATWRVYQIQTSNLSHAGCPCLADYPILGVNRTNVYISTNEFTSDGQGFNGAQLYALSKSQLIAGATSVNTATFQDLSAGGSAAFHVQPANTVAKARAEYLLSSLDPNGTVDNRLAVWAVTNESSVTTGRGMPTLSVRIIGSESYSFPPKAQTPPGFCANCKAPTSGLVDTDFDAMQEVQYVNGQLVGALNTGVTVAGDTTERSGVAWFVIKPSLRGAAVGDATRVIRQDYLSMRGQYLLYPHLNMTSSGAMALVFGLGGPGTYLSAAYSTAARGRDFGPIQVAAAGTGPDNGFSGTAQFGGVGRWGDYSNGEIIPGTNRVWLATQYIPNSGDGYANWGNAIFELRLP